MNRPDQIAQQLVIIAHADAGAAIYWAARPGGSAADIGVDGPVGVLVRPLEQRDFVVVRPIFVEKGHRVLPARAEAVRRFIAESRGVLLDNELEWALGNPRNRLALASWSQATENRTVGGNLFSRTGLAARTRAGDATIVQGFFAPGPALVGAQSARLLASAGTVPGLAVYVAAQTCLQHGLVLGSDAVAEAVWRRIEMATDAVQWVRGFAELDGEGAAEALRCFPGADASMFRYFAEAGVHGEDRRQAAASYPLLATALARRTKLRDAIESREPLQPLLREWLGLSKGALKRLGQLDAVDSPEAPADRPAVVRTTDQLGVQRVRAHLAGDPPLERVLQVLSRLPADWVPADAREWAAFRLIARAVIPVADLLAVSPEEALAGAKGRWQSYVERLARAAGCEVAAFGPEAMVYAISDLLEASEQLAAQVLIPCAFQAAIDTVGRVPDVVSEELRQAALQMAGGCLLSGGLPAGFQRVRTWMSRIAALNGIVAGRGVAPGAGAQSRGADFEALKAADAWPALSLPWMAPNGLLVRPLTSRVELEEESRRLGHCVGSYWTRAFAGRTHIYSIQSGDGLQSLSTFEVNPTVDALGGIEVLQHQGSIAAGRRVPPEAAAAYRSFLAAVDARSIGLDVATTTAWAKAAPTEPGAARNQGPLSVAAIADLAGYAPTDVAVRTGLLEEWRQIAQAGGAEGTRRLDTGEIHELVRSISRHAHIRLRNEAPQL